jgi:hypothetical protein
MLLLFLRIQGQTGSNLHQSVPPLLLPGVSYCLVPSRLWSDAALLVSPNLNRRTPVPYPKELETGTKGGGGASRGDMGYSRHDWRNGNEMGYGLQEQKTFLCSLRSVPLVELSCR